MTAAAQQVQNEMKDVINLKPGESSPFLFYTVHFIDLSMPETFPPKFTIEGLLKYSRQICRSGMTGGGLSESYIKKSVDQSRYLVIASDKTGKHVGAFVLARMDHDDPRGIYVEASCNTPFPSLTRDSDELMIKKAQFEKELKDLSPDQRAEATIQQLKTFGKSVVKGQYSNNPSMYESVLIKKKLEALKLQPVIENVNVRTAQLLKLLMFKYANKIGLKHAYNAAASSNIANFHARNGMVLRSANCDQSDSVADQFASATGDRVQYMEKLVKEGKFTLDKTGSYPMKLCNFDVSVMLAELQHHTLNVLIRVLNNGFTLEDVLDISLEL
jgi:hypothetical protein